MASNVLLAALSIPKLNEAAGRNDKIFDTDDIASAKNRCGAEGSRERFLCLDDAVIYDRNGYGLSRCCTSIENYQLLVYYKG